MKSERKVRLVNGAHKKFTLIPKELEKEKYPFRTGLVLESFRSHRVDMFFDSDLFLIILSECCIRALGEPKTIQMNGCMIKDGLVANLRKYYDSLTEEDHDLPETIVWDDAVGIRESWNLVGGPDLYHDSYTFSIFSRKPIYSKLKMSIPETIQREGGLISCWAIGDILFEEENKSSQATPVIAPR